jgi:hypothetical protein
MRKGDAQAAFMFLGAIIILMVVAKVSIDFVYGQQHIKPTVDKSSNQDNAGTTVQGCTMDNKCNSNPDGSACINIADPNFPERSLKFCGCYTNSQCASTADVQRSGVCGQDDKC